MKASMVPCEAAGKQSKAGMICPSPNVSILNRPPVASSTSFASRWAEPCITSRLVGQVVDMRHWNLGCAMTFGASTSAAAVIAASVPLAVTRNLRRSVVTWASSLNVVASPRHELVIGALGHVVPGADQRLEFRVGGVHLPGHGRLLRFLLDNVDRELLEVAQHGHGELEDFDLAFEFRLEAFEGDRVLGVVGGQSVDLDRRGGMVEDLPQLHGELLVCLLVEGELGHRAGFMPARIVVVPRSLVQAQLHVVV